MSKDPVNETSATQPLTNSARSKGDNPIAAINRLKSVNDNIEMMKNRTLVLKMRDEHLKYRTLDQEKKLSLHQIIHERLQNEREELRKSLEEIRDTKQIKERTQSMRKQIQEGVASARKNVYNNNLQKYEQTTGQAQKNKETIDMNRSIDMAAIKERAQSMKKMEQQEKQMIERKLEERRARILANKAMESLQLKEKSSEGEQLVQKLQQNEMQLIKQASKSIENSRAVNQKYTQMMIHSSNHRAKPSQKSQRLSSSFLPSIKQRNNTSLQVLLV